MQNVFGILLMFTGAALGLLFQDPVVCRFNERNQCYAAMGQRLHLQMPLKDGFNLKITNKNSSRIILKYRINQSNPPTPQHPRWQFVNDDKTLILSSVERSDSGTYTLEIFDTNGSSKDISTLQLNIEAEVSSVKVSYSCLSPGVMKVDCTADGDDLQFSWTSDFNTLPELENGSSVVKLENGSSIVNLAKDHRGKLTCLVENHVSRDHNTIELPPCPEPTTPGVTSQKVSTPSPGTNSTVSYKETKSCNQTLTTLPPSNTNPEFLKYTLISLSSVCVLLVILSIVAFYIYKKKHGSKNKGDPTQDGRELVYAQVTHVPTDNTARRCRTSQAQDEDVEYAVVVTRASKKKQKKYEDEVQYGELVFDAPAKNRRATPKVQDDCVYSQVQRGL